jgi:hypothetical protein
MARTIARLFNTHEEALAAIDDLEKIGVPHSHVSLISNNSESWYDNYAARGAGKGAAVGGLIGGGASILASLSMLAVPGFGPVLVAGWLASTVAGATLGAMTGGLLGVVKEATETEEEAQIFAEGVRRGGSLVSVRTDVTHAGQVEEILNRHGSVDAASRGMEYRERGWDGFDETAPAYSREDIAEERSRYIGGERPAR